MNNVNLRFKEVYEKQIKYACSFSFFRIFLIANKPNKQEFGLA